MDQLLPSQPLEDSPSSSSSPRRLPAAPAPMPAALSTDLAQHFTATLAVAGVSQPGERIAVLVTSDSSMPEFRKGPGETMFLDDKELARLTGFARKTRQVQQLRMMGIPFYVNAAGRAVVTRSVVDGSRQEAKKTVGSWSPAALKRP